MSGGQSPRLWAPCRIRPLASGRLPPEGEIHAERSPFVATYTHLVPPQEGEMIQISNRVLNVPNHPIIPFIEGDGTGPDIWAASVRVFDAAVQKAFKGEKKIVWFEIFA